MWVLAKASDASNYAFERPECAQCQARRPLPWVLSAPGAPPSAAVGRSTATLEPMSSKQVLIAMGVIAFLEGVAGGWVVNEPPSIQRKIFFSNLAINSILVLIWFRTDAAERSYERSRLLTVGVLGLGLVFVPWYLWRSRQGRSRIRAIAYFGLVLLAAIVIQGLGGLVGGFSRIVSGL